MDWMPDLTLVDYFFVGALVIALFVGWFRGLMDILTGLIVFVVTAFVAGRYSHDAVNWLNKTWDLQGKITTYLETRLDLPAEASRAAAQGVPGLQAQAWVQDLPIPKSFQETLIQQLTSESAVAGGLSAAKYLTQQIAGAILDVAVFLVIALVLGWILSRLGRLIRDQIRRLPVVGLVDHALGAVVSGFETAVMLALVAAMISPALSVLGMGSFGEAVQHARLTPHLLKLFEWLQGFLLSTDGGSFFMI